MKIEIYERLIELHHKFGAQEFGKICQKFLAIAFQMNGYSHIVERGVQGVDVDAAGKDGNKYSIEVKTTLSRSVNIEQKDFYGLEDRKKDGYRSVIAALRLDRFSDWIFANADRLKPGNIYIEIVKIHRLKELEESIPTSFDEAVMEHYEGTLDEGQSYLDNVLKQKGVELR